MCVCVCEQLTFTTLVGVDVRALDCGEVEDDGVHSSVGGRLYPDFNGVLPE